MINRELCAFFVCLCLLLGGCVNLGEPTKADKTIYYTLEYAPPAPSQLKSLPVAVRVPRFSVAPTYDTTRIIYRDGSFERDAYVYHRWRVNPGDLVSHFLSRDMKQSGLFEAVLPHGSRVTASHVLDGRVDEFFEWNSEDAWEAVLSVSVIFTVANDPEFGKRPLFQSSYQARIPCKRKTPKALAEAMSQAMLEVTGAIIKDVYSYLND